MNDRQNQLKLASRTSAEVIGITHDKEFIQGEIKMNKKNHLIISVLALLGMVGLLTSCGGGGGGGGTQPLAIAFFNKTVDFLGSGPSSAILNTVTYARWQNLYRASEILGSGKITSIALQYGAAQATDVTCPNMTIKVSHSNLADLTTTFANNLDTGQGSQTTVLSDATVTFPAGAIDSWNNISFTTPYEYNGVDNLIVEFERTSACTGNVQDKYTSGMSYSSVVWTKANGSLTGTANIWLETTKLNFAGGDNKLDYGGVAPTPVPFSTSTTLQRSQMLHTAAVNGSGPVTGIGMVTNSTTTASTYTATIMIGHSTLNDLTTTYANNYSDTPVTVANNLTFTVPAGVPAGETLWLPLDGTL